MQKLWWKAVGAAQLDASLRFVCDWSSIASLCGNIELVGSLTQLSYV